MIMQHGISDFNIGDYSLTPKLYINCNINRVNAYAGANTGTCLCVLGLDFRKSFFSLEVLKYNQAQNVNKIFWAVDGY